MLFLFVAGRFASSLRFQGEVHEATGYVSAFVVSFEPDGAPRWLRAFRADLGLDAWDLAATAAGDSYVAGMAHGTAVLGTATYEAGTVQDALLLALDDAGAVRWFRAYGGDYNFQAHAVDVMTPNRLVLGGFYQSSLPASFGANTLPATLIDDPFVLACDVSASAAEERWARGWHSASYGAIDAIASATDATWACAGGHFATSISLGGDTQSATKAVGGVDWFVAALNADGSARWAAAPGSPGNDAAGSVLATTNVCVVGGMIKGSVDFGGGAVDGAGAEDGFVAAYDAVTGALRWARIIGGQGADWVTHIAAGPGDQLLVAGGFNGTLALPGETLRSAGGSDVVVAALRATDGAVLWARRIGGAGDEQPGGVFLDAASGAVVVSGLFNAPFAAEGVALAHSGEQDAFVVAFRP